MKTTLPHEYKRRETEIKNNEAYQAALKQFNEGAKDPQNGRPRALRVNLLIERALGVNRQNVIAFKNGVFLTVGVICVSFGNQCWKFAPVCRFLPVRMKENHLEMTKK